MTRGIQLAVLEIRVSFKDCIKSISALPLEGLKIIIMLTAKRIDARTGRIVKPMTTPKDPIPVETKIIAKTNLMVVEMIITTGNVFVFSEEIINERNSVEVTVEARSVIAMISKLKSILKISWIRYVIMKNRKLHATAPIVVRNKDAFKKTWTFSSFSSEKFFPKKR